MQPLVSVIITSHSYGRYLAECIASLIGGDTSLGYMEPQTLAPLEIIIVDDASADETRSVGERLAEAHENITYIRRDKRGGTSTANNTGLRAATGKYFTILCADDMRESWALEKMYQACEAHPHSFVYDDLHVFKDGKRDRLWPVSTYNFEHNLHVNQIHCGIMAPLEAWRDVGGYPEIMNDGREDWAMGVALGVKGWCGVHIAEAGYLYRREGQNRSLTNGTQADKEKFQRKMHSLFSNIYAGERPMSCCGGGARVANNGGDQAQSQAQEMLVGAEGMTQMEYLGRNTGNESWYGDVTRATYIFGANDAHRYAWVDNRDVPGFESKREKGKPLFQVAQMVAA